jgi:hypothetical protein
MTTYWAMEYHPFSKRAKPWIHYSSIRTTRCAAWATAYDKATPEWTKEIDRRRRKGLIKCVQVTVQKVGEA